MQPGNRPPLIFCIAKAMERQGIRGGTRLLRSLRRTGWLDRPVDYPVDSTLRIAVPIARNEYDRVDLDNYETEFLDVLSAAIREVSGVFTLIDVGADIGLFSLKLLARSPSISGIVAFEPNSEGFGWLKFNLGRLSIPSQAIMAAVADFEGTASLIAPEARWMNGVATNHTQYFLEASPGGPITVTTIDSVPSVVNRNLVIKLDVEGGEMAALRGAARTIASAPRVIVAIEAHPAVAARTGIDPVQCLRLLASFRPFHFVVGETGAAVNAEMPLFEQIAPDQIYNIVATSR
jgi:FkbM family methyltransferase